MSKKLHPIRETARYIVFGILAMFINIALFVVLYNFAGLSAAPANIIAWIPSVIFAYVTSRKWVFYSENRTWREPAAFFISRFVVGIFETVFVHVAIDVLDFNETGMKVLSSVIAGILNFFISKLIVFRQRRK